MAGWPDTAELAQVLDVENVGDWAITLNRVLASAIERVKLDVGAWDPDVDEPDDALAQAALRMAELISERPSQSDQSFRLIATASVAHDPTYRRLLFGHRRRYGVA
jgi:hypothetical protein